MGFFLCRSRPVRKVMSLCRSLHPAAGVEAGRGEHQLLPPADREVSDARGESLPRYRVSVSAWLRGLRIMAVAVQNVIPNGIKLCAN